MSWITRVKGNTCLDKITRCEKGNGNRFGRLFSHWKSTRISRMSSSLGSDDFSLLGRAVGCWGIERDLFPDFCEDGGPLLFFRHRTVRGPFEMRHYRIRTFPLGWNRNARLNLYSQLNITIKDYQVERANRQMLFKIDSCMASISAIPFNSIGPLSIRFNCRSRMFPFARFSISVGQL